MAADASGYRVHSTTDKSRSRKRERFSFGCSVVEEEAVFLTSDELEARVAKSLRLEGLPDEPMRRGDDIIFVIHNRSGAKLGEFAFKAGDQEASSRTGVMIYTSEQRALAEFKGIIGNISFDIHNEENWKRTRLQEAARRELLGRVGAWHTRVMEMDRASVEQNVEPYLRSQVGVMGVGAAGVPLMAVGTIRRSIADDGRIVFDIALPMIDAGRPVANLCLQLIKLGEDQTRIDARVKDATHTLDHKWLTAFVDRFAGYLVPPAGNSVSQAGPAGGNSTPAGGAPMPAAGTVKRGPHEGKLELWAKFKAIKDQNPAFSRRQVAIKASTEDTQYTEAQVRYGFQQMGWEWVSGYEAR